MSKRTIRLTESDLHNIIKESVKKVLKEDELNQEERFWREVQLEISNVKEFSNKLVDVINTLEMEDESTFNDAFALEKCVDRLSNLIGQAQNAYKGKLNY